MIFEIKSLEGKTLSFQKQLFIDNFSKRYLENTFVERDYGADVHNAIHTANISNSRPSSTRRAQTAQKAADAAQGARTQQVGAEIVNSIVSASPTTTKRTFVEITADFSAENEKEKEFKLAFPIFGQ